MTPDPKNLPNSKTAPGTSLRNRRVRLVMTGKRVPTRDVTRMTKMEPTWGKDNSLVGTWLTRRPRLFESFGPQSPSSRASIGIVHCATGVLARLCIRRSAALHWSRGAAFYTVHSDAGGFNLRTLPAPRSAERMYPKVIVLAHLRDGEGRTLPLCHKRPSLLSLTKIAGRSCALPHSPRVAVIRAARL